MVKRFLRSKSSTIYSGERIHSTYSVISSIMMDTIFLNLPKLDIASLICRQISEKLILLRCVKTQNIHTRANRLIDLDLVGNTRRDRGPRAPDGRIHPARGVAKGVRRPPPADRRPPLTVGLIVR